MRNTKTILNLFVMTGLSLSFGLLTACGGGDSKSEPVVTTLPNCTQSSIFNSQTGIWTLSSADSRECRAITTVSQNVTCPSNQVKVRIPISSNQGLNTSSNVVNNNQAQQVCILQSNGQTVCGTQTTNNFQLNNNTNYHSSVSSYKETCLSQTSQEWYYIVNAGSYYYLDYSLAYNHYQDYQYQYRYQYSRQLSPKETILTFGVLAAALFFLAN